MSYCYWKECGQGLTSLYGFPETCVRHLSIGAIRLHREDRFGETLNRRECVIFLLKGTVSIKGNALSNEVLEAVASLDHASPVAIHCPPGIFSMKALSDAELVIIRGELPTNSDGGEGKIIHSRTLPAQSLAEVLYAPQEGSLLTSGCMAFDAGSCDITLDGLYDGAGEGELEAILYFVARDPRCVAEIHMRDVGGRQKETCRIVDGTVLAVPAGLRPALVRSSHGLLCCWGTRVRIPEASSAR